MRGKHYTRIGNGCEIISSTETHLSLGIPKLFLGAPLEFHTFSVHLAHTKTYMEPIESSRILVRPHNLTSEAQRGSSASPPGVR